MHWLYRFVKNWMLLLSIVAGIIGYFIFASLPLEANTKYCTYISITHYIQPVLIFVMLFLSFLKVSPKEMRPRRWQLWVLVVQTGLFIFFSLLAMSMPNEGLKVLCEGAMLCFLCPTATASAVITGKLGGSTSGVVTYLIICNLMVSVVAPLFLPLVESSDITFLGAFLAILSKIFPMLILPLAFAWFVRFCVSFLYRWLIKFRDLSFYIWGVSLSLAIAVTVRSIVHSSVDIWFLFGLALISCICCFMQFRVGQYIGKCYGKSEEITAGQAFGQKNTVFVIWMGQVFLNPVTSVVGGFYSLWHNAMNTWELYRARKAGIKENG